MTVFIPKKVYLTIVAASVRFANLKIPQDDWLEVSGIFIGKNEGEHVFISEAYPIMHQELDKNAVIDQYKWSDEDYEALYIIDDEAFAHGEFTVGWWHSHPGFKVMMSHIDIKTTLSYQTNNQLAISLVFNPMRLLKQIELPNKKGDPVKQLKNDPGFKIFRLDDVNRGIEASYHTIDYKVNDYESMEQLVASTQKFIIDVTKLFPKDNIDEVYAKFIKERINKLNSLLLGTEEYLMTLVRKGESNRIPEVLRNQTNDIRNYVAKTFIKIENIKEFMNYLEYKERDIIIPKIEGILAEWDENVSKLNDKLTQISKKF
ncbi:MAG: Mov34/MPN/PAD-1 family protein [Candidatus Thorarchaeota archaeon]